MEKRLNDRKDFNKKILTIPNILSAMRVCLVPIIVWLYCAKNNDIAAGIVLIISGITDIIDGYIARRLNMISDLGKILDPFADKLTQATMLICLFIRFPLMIVPCIVLVVKEIITGIIGAMLIKKTGKVFGSVWHGKVATCLLYVMMTLHIFWSKIPSDISALTIWSCVIMIGVSFVLYTIRNLKALRENNL